MLFFLPFYSYLYATNFKFAQTSPLTVIISGVIILITFVVSYYFLNKNKKLYEMVIDKSLAGVYVVSENKVSYINKRGASFFGYLTNEMINMDIMNLFSEVEKNRVEENVRKLFEGEVSISHEEYQCIKKDGQRVLIEINGSVTNYKGKPAIIGTFNDLTLQKQVSGAITFYDPITKLPTVSALSHIMTEHLESNGEEPMSLLFIRLSRLVSIQGAYGLSIGDKLLILVIDRVKRLLKKEDIVTRYSDNKLIVFMFNGNKEAALKLAIEIVNSFQDPFHFDKYHILESVNIGISTYPEFKTIEKLTEHAKIAMEVSRKEGPNQIRLFDLSLQQKVTEQADIERELNQAIDNGEFIVYYQPKVDLVTGKINGIEALLRWLHPVNGMIAPGTFIPIAERIGLIIPLTHWVIREVSRQLNEWQQSPLPQVPVSINISPLHFLQPDFTKSILETLEETGIDPKCIELEVTESNAINFDLAIEKLMKLREHGFKISLDDFGSGYSSLGQVNRLPLDKVKIDQSFMRHQFADPDNRSIISSVIAMAHNLKCAVVAEGVETVEQLIFLQQHACDEVQGFLFSEPLPPKLLEMKWIEIEQIVREKGLSKRKMAKYQSNESLRLKREDIEAGVRSQWGLMFKFVKRDDVFVYTLCEGELLNKLGFQSDEWVGLKPEDLFSEKEYARKLPLFERAWNGEEGVFFESELNGIAYMGYLNPIRRNGIISEVVGTAIEVNDKMHLEKVYTLEEE